MGISSGATVIISQYYGVKKADILLGICVLRVVWVFAAVPLRRDITTVIFSFPLTWVVTPAILFIYLHRFSRLR